VLLTVTGWSRASLSPLAGAARTPVGTPGPSPPSVDHPEVPGVLGGPGAFGGAVVRAPTTPPVAAQSTPDGATADLVARLTALTPEDVLTLLLASPFARDEWPSFVTRPAVVEPWPEGDTDLEGAVGGVVVREEDRSALRRSIGYIVFPTAAAAQLLTEAMLENAGFEGVPITPPTDGVFPAISVRTEGGDTTGTVIVLVGNVLVLGMAKTDAPRTNQGSAEARAQALALAGVPHLERLIAVSLPGDP